jgi:hypothetical protein
MRPEQRVVQDAENSSVSADAKSEKGNSAGAEPPVFHQAPYGVLAVAPQRIEHPPSKRIAAFFAVARYGYSFHGAASLNMRNGEPASNIPWLGFKND